MSKLAMAWSAAVLTVFFSTALHAGQPAMTWTVEPLTFEAARGQTVQVTVVGKPPEGWYTYSPKFYKEDDVQFTSFAFEPETALKINGEIKYSDFKLKDNILLAKAKQSENFFHEMKLVIPIRISPDLKPGEHKIKFMISSLYCIDEKPAALGKPKQNGQCVPSTPEYTLTVKVSDAPVVKDLLLPTDGGNEKALDHARKEGLLAYLLLALGAGATALLTPCVFPMIPITVSFFTKRKHVSRQRSIRDAGVYALGIIFTFTGLGFLFALLLGATGITDFAANPWVNLFVAAVFVMLAGSLFGFYELQLPTGILNKLNASANEGEGILSVLLMGLVFSLTSFTCTVPFVGAIMVAATQGDWLWPLAGMLVFSTVFAAPFFLLALFPVALKSLPRSGGWLNSVKVVMGFLEIAAAMKFFSNVDLVWEWNLLTRNVFLMIWVLLALASAAYLCGLIKFSHDSELKSMSKVRIFSAASFVGVALFFGAGIFGMGLGIFEGYIPPRAHAGWVEDWEKGLAESKLTGKPIFVDFTGKTCTNCRLMEANMFPKVDALLQQYVRVRLYTDERKGDKGLRSRRNQAILQERYNTVALPYYAIIGPDGKDLSEPFPGLTYDQVEFETFLKKGLTPLQAPAEPSPKVAESLPR